MVASPNVDFGGANGLANFLQDMQRQIDENGRRSTYPFSAGPGGTLQVYPDPSIKDANGRPVVDTVLKYETGTTALAIKPGVPQYGSKQQMVLNDLAGNAVFRTDESAGYGLSDPIYSYFMGTQYSGTSAASNTANAEVVTALSECIYYNPALWIKCLVTMGVGIGWSGRYQLSNGVTSVFSTSTSFTGSGYCAKSLLLPPEYIGHQGVSVKFLVTPTVTGTALTFPQTCMGTAKSVYDQNPGTW